MSTPALHQKLIGDRSLVAFDTETTGLWAVSDRLVEIGAVKFRLGENPTATFQELINPEREIPPDAIAVHHINNSMVLNAPKAAEVLGRFVEFIGDAVLVAHNAPFDISFVGVELDRARLTIPDNPVLDTVDIFHRLFPGAPSYSLLSLISAFKIAQNQEHRALSDALHVRSLMEEAAVRLADLPDPVAVYQTFGRHSLQEWRAKEIDLPAEFTDLTIAIEQKLAIEILYATENGIPQKRIIHPKQIQAKRSLYYIIAYCQTAQAERTFRLDRIQSFQLIDS
ncbi:MAG: WYL domain-containing protein [bacterium]|nr:WYL domain-containing protein [bacterium]